VVVADTSFLTSIYLAQSTSARANALMRQLVESVVFTPLHGHELRNAIRLAVFRKLIAPPERHALLAKIERDIADRILVHVPLRWTELFQEAEELGAQYTETLGMRGMDILHVAVARILDIADFLSFDVRQRELARRTGLRVLPQTL
jgi:predicted nucleic acid-binding protein